MESFLQTAGVYYNDTVLSKSVQLLAYTDEIVIVGSRNVTDVYSAIELESADKGLAVAKPGICCRLLETAYSRQLHLRYCERSCLP